ncbi:dipeptidase [Anaerobacillus isosaccharinicus]|uniref:Diguanylate cyclase n=1 Tax=Anaerobacillus isosaccharinicus TaxID=1532552 RepID=A0A1S2M9E6_9BACI|nr:membrane dipeptidase [Anaerobacillus isosaccharinicus]MBA5587201.1 membrane dipeptidase [Anaerobacillus isosaccharinicus]QOY34604.1 membrane dipeptidase [Anaerobacillus isosaccharinicus]
MNDKNYDGYQSFQYLEAGKHYKSFQLADKGRHKKTHAIALTIDQQKKLETIFNYYPIISLRDHGFIVPKKQDDILPYCRQLHTIYDYEGLAQSGIDVIFENFMDGIAIVTSNNGLKWDDVIYTLGMRFCDISKQHTVYLAKTWNDLIEAKSKRKIALLPSLEAASILENEVDRVDILYGLGIRCMGITYNESNTLGSGLTEKNDGGLTKFGRKVIERMNVLGMAIDISHCGDQTSLDVIKASSDPVFITHAGARGVWDTPRMKSDEVLKACAEKGGIIGVCAAPNTTLSPKSPNKHTIDSVMEHFEYLVDLVGINHVGLGPDTFFGDHVGLQNAFDSILAISESHSGQHFEESPYVLGLENPTEAMENMLRWLLVKNYSVQDIAKVSGENALVALERILDKEN